jgi:hypothetical protein
MFYISLLRLLQHKYCNTEDYSLDSLEQKKTRLLVAFICPSATQGPCLIHRNLVMC